MRSSVSLYPFCVLFGYILKGRYGVSVIFCSTAGLLTFVFVVNVVAFGSLATQNYLIRDANCADIVINTMVGKYNKDLLAAQQRGLDDFANIKKNVSSGLVAFYCGNDLNFRLGRALGIGLKVIYRTPDGTALDKTEVAPDGCGRGGAE